MRDGRPAQGVSGCREVRCDACDLSAGAYLQVLAAGNHQSMKQMVLLK